MKLHIKTNGDDSKTPGFSKSINDIFKHLQSCDLPTPPGTHVVNRPSIRSASDLNDDQHAEEEPFDFVQQDPEPEHIDFENEIAPTINAIDLKKRIKQLCLACGGRGYAKDSCRARGQHFLPLAMQRRIAHINKTHGDEPKPLPKDANLPPLLAGIASLCVPCKESQPNPDNRKKFLLGRNFA